MGNYHAGFLGGKGAVRPLTYPVRDATFFPVIPHFLADKGTWIFAPNVAARADIAPSCQRFFHFHLRILSSGVLACRIKKAQES
jgi:hypothetical protein